MKIKNHIDSISQWSGNIVRWMSAVLTAAAPDLALEELLPGIECRAAPSDGTTRIRNVYSDGHRQQNAGRPDQDSRQPKPPGTAAEARPIPGGEKPGHPGDARGPRPGLP